MHAWLEAPNLNDVSAVRHRGGRLDTRLGMATVRLQ